MEYGGIVSGDTFQNVSDVCTPPHPQHVPVTTYDQASEKMVINTC